MSQNKKVIEAQDNNAPGEHKITANNPDDLIAEFQAESKKRNTSRK